MDEYLNELPKRPCWCGKKRIKERLGTYHDRFAKSPKDDLKQAKDHFEKNYLKKLERKLKERKWCKTLVFAGSSYEGLKISKDVIEVDVMFIIDGKDLVERPISDDIKHTDEQDGKDLVEESISSGYCYLSLPDVCPKYSVLSKLTDKKCCVKPEQIKNKFFGVLQTLLNELGLRKTIKLRHHGPAVQMDVKREGKLWYSVDLVPAIEISTKKDGEISTKDGGENKLYVPKLFENKIPAWRRSFSTKEKDFLKRLDQDHCCRRKVLRVMKTMCKSESTLLPLNSYILKNILFHMKTAEIERKDDFWSENNLHLRFFDFLGFTEKFLMESCLPQYYCPAINLIGHFKPKQRENILNRITSLRMNEKKFLRAITISRDTC